VKRTKADDERLRALVREGVLAYLRDEKADVLNIADAAIADSPVLTALNLTAVAGKAIRILAEARGVSDVEALALVTGSTARCDEATGV